MVEECIDFVNRNGTGVLSDYKCKDIWRDLGLPLYDDEVDVCVQHFRGLGEGFVSAKHVSKWLKTFVKNATKTGELGDISLDTILDRLGSLLRRGSTKVITIKK